MADPELRALHLAHAADRPDAALAAGVGAAADAAGARGAAAEAVELAGHALRLTPLGAPERTQRVLALATHLERAGERRRITDLLTPELDALPPGEARVRAWLMLADGGAIWGHEDHLRHVERALAESGDDPLLRAAALATKALSTAAEGVARLADAEAWAQEALAAADGAGVAGRPCARSAGRGPCADGRSTRSARASAPRPATPAR